MRTHVYLALCSLLLVPLAACGDKAPAAKKPTPVVTGAQTTEPEASDPASGPVVKLVDPGAEPRNVLRFRPKEGDTQKVSMHMKMWMDFIFGGSNHPADMPTVTMVMDVTTGRIAGNGDITFSYVASGIEVGDDGNSAMKAPLAAAMASLDGMSGTMTMTDRGFTKASEVTLPPGATPQVAQMMDQMKDSMKQLSVLLPRDPIGVGGKWSVDTMVVSQAITMLQRATYHVVKIEQGRLTVRAKIEQSAAPQPMVNPTMPALKMQLVRMAGGGGGETTFDLGKPMPVKGAVDMRAEMEITVTQNGTQQPMAMKMTVGMTMD